METGTVNRPVASIEILETIAYIEKLADETNSMFHAKLECVMLSTPKGWSADAPLEQVEQELPPYFADLRIKLDQIQASLLHLRNGINRVEFP